MRELNSIWCSVTVIGNATGVRVCEVYKNAAQFQGGARTQAMNAGASRHVVVNASGPVTTVSGGDYFECEVFQDSGGALSVTANVNTWCALEVVE